MWVCNFKLIFFSHQAPNFEFFACHAAFMLNFQKHPNFFNFWWIIEKFQQGPLHSDTLYMDFMVKEKKRTLWTAPIITAVLRWDHRVRAQVSRCAAIVIVMCSVILPPQPTWAWHRVTNEGPHRESQSRTRTLLVPSPMFNGLWSHDKYRHYANQLPVPFLCIVF